MKYGGEQLRRKARDGTKRVYASVEEARLGLKSNDLVFDKRQRVLWDRCATMLLDQRVVELDARLKRALPILAYAAMRVRVDLTGEKNHVLVLGRIPWCHIQGRCRAELI